MLDAAVLRDEFRLSNLVASQGARWPAGAPAFPVPSRTRAATAVSTGDGGPAASSTATRHA